MLVLQMLSKQLSTSNPQRIAAGSWRPSTMRPLAEFSGTSSRRPCTIANATRAVVQGPGACCLYCWRFHSICGHITDVATAIKMFTWHLTIYRWFFYTCVHRICPGHARRDSTKWRSFSFTSLVVMVLSHTKDADVYRIWWNIFSLISKGIINLFNIKYVAGGYMWMLRYVRMMGLTYE